MHSVRIESWAEGAKVNTSPRFGGTFDPATGTFRWEVNCDETIADKVRRVYRKSVSGMSEYQIDKIDEQFPDTRKGKHVITGTIFLPDLQHMEWEEVEEGCGVGIPARPKDLLDFGMSFPRPMPGSEMSLVAFGQADGDVYGNRCYTALMPNGRGRQFQKCWIHPRLGRWHHGHHGLGFLLLEKLPPEWRRRVGKW
ncbi:MAG: hypothetical protein KBD16_00440 [Candidatus Pacebacteria bacterium]|nr:hypothetical protein [Candidatus Paceibacterota bacterium]